jgi:hypothetical protein
MAVINAELSDEKNPAEVQKRLLLFCYRTVPEK